MRYRIRSEDIKLGNYEDQSATNARATFSALNVATFAEDIQSLSSQKATVDDSWNDIRTAQDLKDSEVASRDSGPVEAFFERSTDTRFEVIEGTDFDLVAIEFPLPDVTGGMAAIDKSQREIAPDDWGDSFENAELSADPTRDAHLDVSEAHANIDMRAATARPLPASSGVAEALDPDQFEAVIRATYHTTIEPQPAAFTVSAGASKVQLNGRLNSKFAIACGNSTADTQANEKPQGRGCGRRKRAANALRAIVRTDPRYRAAGEIAEAMDRLFDEALSSGVHIRIASAHDALTDSMRVREDFHLIHLASSADRIERCGSYATFACNSYWCSHCKKRFGARLLQDTQAQLKQRYGKDLEKARDNLLHVTILSDIVIPDPDVDRYQLADFGASIVRRDHLDIVRHLSRLQEDRRSAMSDRLIKRGLSLELAQDWIASDNRDRQFYDPENLTADATRLIEWNEVIEQARNRFRPRSQRTRSDLESATLISCRDEDRFEAYLWQLRKGETLDREDVIALAQGFQLITREFRGINKTNYPEKLKSKSSIEKVMKRERKKLYRLAKDLHGVSVIGAFELELIDLCHAISGEHSNRIKSQTLRVLASQERKPTKHRKTEKPISFETQRRRQSTELKKRLLDEARQRIAANQDLTSGEFHGLKYAVLLHMHVLIDLNGTHRDDLERWLTGKAVGQRRFTGQWNLPYQVMVKSLFENKPVEDSLRHISFYPIKGPLAFNYENKAPERDEERSDNAATFSDEALALIACLQLGIGHESLRIAIDWPGVEREKRGRKPTRAPTPKMTDDELVEALQERGVDLPVDPIGETDISVLFELYAQGSAGGIEHAATSSPAEQGAEVRGINDTAPTPAANENNDSSQIM